MKKLAFLLVIVTQCAIGQTEIDSLKNVVENSQSPYARLKALTKLTGRLTFQDGRAAKGYAHQSIDLARKLQNDTALADANNSLGIILANQGKMDSAMIHFEINYKLRKELKDSVALANAVNNIGLVLQMQKRYEDALDYLFESLEIDRALGNEAGMARSYHNISQMYGFLHDYDNEITYLKKAYALNVKVGNKNWQAANLMSMATTLKKVGNLDSTLILHLKADSIYSEINNVQGLSQSSSNLASYYYNSDNVDKAYFYAKRSLEAANEYGDDRGSAGSYLILGKILLEQGNQDSALMLVRKGYQLVENTEDIDYKLDALFSIAYVSGRVGKFEEAYNHMVEYVDLRDSFQSGMLEQKMADLATRYMVQEKDNEIALKEEQKRNAELKEKQAEAESDRKSVMIAGLGLLVLMVLILVGIVIKRNREKHKVNLKLQEQNEKITNQKEEIESQKDIIEEKNKDILDSINYAKRIQGALLRGEDELLKHFREAFILYLPKDIVSGDFYWMKEIDDQFLLAVVDCTGHGVPGAMVSLLGNSGLNQAVNEFGLRLPGAIMDQLSDTIVNSLSNEDEVKDGMDMALLSKTGNKIMYAGANNPLWILRKNELLRFTPDKQPVGEFEDRQPFSTQEILVEEGDTLYLFSDGYVDQFGGDKGKKLKSKAFADLLLNIGRMSLQQQKKELLNFFNEWKRDFEQLDDVCVIGVRV